MKKMTILINKRRMITQKMMSTKTEIIKSDVEEDMKIEVMVTKVGEEEIVGMTKVVREATKERMKAKEVIIRIITIIITTINIKTTINQDVAGIEIIGEVIVIEEEVVKEVTDAVKMTIKMKAQVSQIKKIK